MYVCKNVRLRGRFMCMKMVLQGDCVVESQYGTKNLNVNTEKNVSNVWRYEHGLVLFAKKQLAVT